MTAPLVLDAQSVEQLMPIGDAISTLAQGFREGMGSSDPPRTAVPWINGELLVMPSQSGAWAGVKLITVGNRKPGSAIPRIQGTYVLFEADSLTPRVVMDAVALTNLRTAAVSAVATDALAQLDATRLVIFGTGPQARWHARAMCAVRAIDHVTIIGRTPQAAERLIAELTAELAITVEADSPSALHDADVVCTCTTASTPLFDSELLSDGVHVNAIGSHTPSAREVDSDLVRRSTIVVENDAAARREAGDLIVPWAAGVVTESVFGLELGTVLRQENRVTSGRPTLFKSVGMAAEDLCLAAAIFERTLTALT